MPGGRLDIALPTGLLQLGFVGGILALAVWTLSRDRARSENLAATALRGQAAEIAHASPAQLERLAAALEQTPGFLWMARLDAEGRVVFGRGAAGSQSEEQARRRATLLASAAAISVPLLQHRDGLWLALHPVQQDGQSVRTAAVALDPAALSDRRGPLALLGLALLALLLWALQSHRLRNARASLSAQLSSQRHASENLAQQLRARETHAEATVQALNRARAELLESTRQATAGETAAMAAHEILNPVTGIAARLGELSWRVGEELPANAEALRDVLEAWETAWRRGGAEGLRACLEVELRGADGATHLAVEDDFRVLRALLTYLEGAVDELGRDLGFCLREIGRVTRNVESMQALGQHRRDGDAHSVEEILAEALEIAVCGVRGHRASVEVDCPPTLRWIVDRHDALQALNHLLRNALQAVVSQYGARGGRIRLLAQQRGDEVELQIADDGCGLRAEDATRIFEMGFTSKAPGEGTGLGLGIARRLLRQHGGELQLAHANPGAGATFSITLPAAPDMPPAAVQTSVPSPSKESRV